ncbi:MAG TPA: guanylate kinase [Ignavibacteria bacterium]|nr:guanylate kinase [Ignavibacteria bacterium]
MLFVICASSGAGKTTIIRELFKKFPEIKFSVSATTRKKRPNETNGKDYYFISMDEYNKLKADNKFIETEEVHGNFYGTLKSEAEPFLKSDDIMILDVDVKGALNIKKMYPEAVTVFIDVPFDELLRRLRNRNTETEEEINKRASRIKMEAGLKDKFDCIVDNSSGIEQAVTETEKIINKYIKQ